ncbi:MAG: hypothetical protein K2X27_02910 [Candidatus Obscuribacterales bacterium]|nr:hypothetical protein [Candidatus Obscuribacterales bacterium]
MSLKIAFMTGNSRKLEEYRRQLARYAREVIALPYSDDDELRLKTIVEYLQQAEAKDRFVLRESSDLYLADELEAGNEILSSKSEDGQRVYHISRLTVYTLDDNGELCSRQYSAQLEGHLCLSLRSADSGDQRWWDDIFVLKRSESSYLRERDLFEGKASARQLAIGQFICDFVHFKQLKDLSYKPHKPSQAVDFHPELSAASVLRRNEFVQMAELHSSPWGLGNLVCNLTNAGSFFRSADSRRSGNYFLPPLSGIPRFQKPDPFHETTFQFHDYCHQAMPDQLYTGISGPAHRHVYVVARLMSEGLSLVLADMLFVNAIKAADFKYDFSARKINQLFDALDLPGKSRRGQLKTLLAANIDFANLGDSSGFCRMLRDGEQASQALEAHTSTYKHFFVPDLIWSAENYDDMCKRSAEFSAWSELIGKDLFQRARLLLLDDLVTALRDEGADLSSYRSSVKPVFEHVFERILSPQLEAASPLADEDSISNAFLRYMIGQCFIYGKFCRVPAFLARGKDMASRLRETSRFTQEQIEQIRQSYNQDLLWLYQRGLIGPEDLKTYEQICPLFAPTFLSYDFSKTPYNSVADAIDAVFPDQDKKAGD